MMCFSFRKFCEGASDDLIFRAITYLQTSPLPKAKQVYQSLTALDDQSLSRLVGGVRDRLAPEATINDVVTMLRQGLMAPPGEVPAASQAMVTTPRPTTTPGPVRREPVSQESANGAVRAFLAKNPSQTTGSLIALGPDAALGLKRELDAGRLPSFPSAKDAIMYGPRGASFYRDRSGSWQWAWKA
jgi:hypothetical protein